MLDDTTETLLEVEKNSQQTLLLLMVLRSNLNDKRFGVKVGYNSELKAFDLVVELLVKLLLLTVLLVLPQTKQLQVL